MKRDKVNKYILGLLGIFFLYINPSWAREYGIGIVKIPDGPLKDAILPKNSQDNIMEIQWQITDDANIPVDSRGFYETKVTTTLQMGNKSYVYITSEEFSNLFPSQLTSFAGIYKKDDHDYAVAYKILRSFTGGEHKWKIIFSEPFKLDNPDKVDYLTINPFKKPMSQYTEAPMFVRADYQVNREKERTDYSSNLELEQKGFLDSRFKELNINEKGNKNLDKKIIDIKKLGNMYNVGLVYCAFDVNEVAGADPLIRYVSWMRFEEPEIRSLPSAANSISFPDVFDKYSLEQTTIKFSITALNIALDFQMTSANGLSADRIKKLKDLRFPTDIENLTPFQSSQIVYGKIFGTYKGEVLKQEHDSICHIWRSQVASDRSDRTTPDIKIGTDAIKNFWRTLDRGELGLKEKTIDKETTLRRIKEQRDQLAREQAERLERQRQLQVGTPGNQDTQKSSEPKDSNTPDFEKKDNSL